MSRVDAIRRDRIIWIRRLGCRRSAHVQPGHLVQTQRQRVGNRSERVDRLRDPRRPPVRRCRASDEPATRCRSYERGLCTRLDGPRHRERVRDSAAVTGQVQNDAGPDWPLSDAGAVDVLDVTVVGTVLREVLAGLLLHGGRRRTVAVGSERPLDRVDRSHRSLGRGGQRRGAGVGARRDHHGGRDPGDEHDRDTERERTVRRLGTRRGRHAGATGRKPARVVAR